MTFDSEVFFNGRNYPFRATFSSRQWTARIRDEGGVLHGVIQCVAPGPSLNGDQLEDEVCDWVHRSVRGRAGFFDAAVADISLAWPAAAPAELPALPDSTVGELVSRSVALRAELVERVAVIRGVMDRLAEAVDQSRERRTMDR
ncbi:hypothetical protein [Xylophilus sp. GOD-11R]|uniref:hypothetical protein n=1 Tax=Xylophilus sp. GOD-11R TaxID=3089814 RepID=UPI00298C0B12|nr:hypothetical protein [Xylophilus sp. GOD-11R]WPB56076.1 hypothetical protein R9X41_18300 [Xylophilus sp. GOD-11R]